MKINALLFLPFVFLLNTNNVLAEESTQPDAKLVKCQTLSNWKDAKECYVNASWRYAEQKNYEDGDAHVVKQAFKYGALTPADDDSYPIVLAVNHHTNGDFDIKFVSLKGKFNCQQDCKVTLRFDDKELLTIHAKPEEEGKKIKLDNAAVILAEIQKSKEMKVDLPVQNSANNASKYHFTIDGLTVPE